MSQPNAPIRFMGGSKVNKEYKGPWWRWLIVITFWFIYLDVIYDHIPPLFLLRGFLNGMMIVGMMSLEKWLKRKYGHKKPD